MTLAQLRQQCITALQDVYDSREAQNITRLVAEHVTGFNGSQMLIAMRDEAQEKVVAAVQALLPRLQNHEPVQYVLNEAWFYGLQLYVDRHVLIPRPETEELVEQVLKEWALLEFPNPTILDVGTGSGCIAIALAKHISNSPVWAIDVSEEALAIAARNARHHGTDIHFAQLDFTDPFSWSSLPQFNIIVSNPPYIPLAGKHAMQPNVVDHEPHGALFVPDEQPLLFYELLARFGHTHLLPGGCIACEIHEDLGPATKAVFEQAGYHDVTIHTDMQGKERIVVALPARHF